MKKLMKLGGQMTVGGIGLGIGMGIGAESGANMGGVAKISQAMPKISTLAVGDYMITKVKKMGKKIY